MAAAPVDQLEKDRQQVSILPMFQLTPVCDTFRHELRIYRNLDVGRFINMAEDLDGSPKLVAQSVGLAPGLPRNPCAAGIDGVVSIHDEIKVFASSRVCTPTSFCHATRRLTSELTALVPSTMRSRWLLHRQKHHHCRLFSFFSQASMSCRQVARPCSKSFFVTAPTLYPCHTRSRLGISVGHDQIYERTTERHQTQERCLGMSPRRHFPHFGPWRAPSLGSHDNVDPSKLGSVSCATLRDLSDADRSVNGLKQTDEMVIDMDPIGFTTPDLLQKW